FAADGTIEMDASIMYGQDLKGAGVASIHFTRHPVDLARAVMENTQYVLMVGSGAHAFSKAQGLEQEPQSFFFTEMRWKEFEQVMRTSNRLIPPFPTAFSFHLDPKAQGHFEHWLKCTRVVAPVRYCRRCCTRR